MPPAPDELDLPTACVLARHDRVAEILAQFPEAATQPDAQSRDGSWLPLQYCARSKTGSDADRLATVTLLLDHGTEAASALDHACWADNGTIADLLLERGARLGDNDTPNHLACDGPVRRAGVAAAPRRHRHERHMRHRPSGRLQPAGLRCQPAQPVGRHLVPILRLRPEPDNEPNRRDRAARGGEHSGAGVPLVDRGVDLAQRDDADQTALDLARAKKRTKPIEFLATL